MNKIQLCSDKVLEDAVRITEPADVIIGKGVTLPPVASINMGDGHKNGKGTGYGWGCGSGYGDGCGEGHPNVYPWGHRYGDVQNNFR